MTDPEHVVSARTVYDHSADRYVDAVGTEVSGRFETLLDQAVLGAFSDQVRSETPGPVLDVGCGPGRITAYLSQRGLDVRGIDISARMIEAACAAHPELRFDVGSLTDLGADDHSLTAAVYWYSIIATPLTELGAAWTELDRVLTTDGHALVAFQAGDNDRVDRPDAYGSSSTLTLYRHRIDDVIASLAAAGFEIRADVRRPAELAHETTPQAIIVARRRRP